MQKRWRKSNRINHTLTGRRRGGREEDRADEGKDAGDFVVLYCVMHARDVRMRVVLQEGVVCGIEVDNKKQRDERREEEKGE